MELQKLDSVFQADVPIENYESLIWTERYAQAGDFELVSSDVSRCLQMMPLESYVGLRESTVPMIVESHKIIKEKHKAPKIEIRGRSFDSVLERRGSVFGALPLNGARALWAPSFVKQSDAAYFVMRTVLGDVVRIKGSQTFLPAVSPAVSALDAIPEIETPLPLDYAWPGAPAWASGTTYAIGNQVTRSGKIYEAILASSTADPDISPTYWKLMGTPVAMEIQSGNLYPVMLELIQANHHGIKAVRPPSGGSKTTVDIEIYNGADLTGTTTFDVKFDQFDDATYLLSYQGSANIAYVYGGGTATSTAGVPAGGDRVRKNNAGSEVSGLARRVMVVDEQSETTLNSPTVRTSRGLVELYKNNAIAIFDGELAQQIATKYNKNVNSGGYSLGDIVKLNGEYNLSRNVRVVEFIRTSDASGESAYPSFEVIDE